jgi:hypothetical protein
VKTSLEAGHSIHRQEQSLIVTLIVAFAMCSSLCFLGCRVSDLSLHIKEGSISGQTTPASEDASVTNSIVSSPSL